MPVRARRPRKRVVNIACAEEGVRTGAVRRKPHVSVSHIGLGCFPKDETWWRFPGQCHTTDKVAFQGIDSHWSRGYLPDFPDTALMKGIKSKVNLRMALLLLDSVNTGSPKLVRWRKAAYR